MQILSPRTLIFIKDLMYEIFTKNKFEEFLYKLGLTDHEVSLIYNGWNKEKLMFEVLKAYNEYPTKGEPFMYSLLKEFLKIYKRRSKEEQYNELIRVLLEDGIHIEGTTVETVAGKIAEPVKEENYLFTKLEALDFNSVIHYLKQSYDNYVKGHWEASNGMTRTSFEELLKSIATNIAKERKETIPISSKRAKTPQPVDYRNYLKEVNFIEGKEFALLEAFYQFGSTKGAHPGLSDASDCRLRRFMLVGLCLQYLEKYTNFLKT